MKFDISFKFVFASNNPKFRLEVIPYFTTLVNVNVISRNISFEKCCSKTLGSTSIIGVNFTCIEEFIFI